MTDAQVERAVDAFEAKNGSIDDLLDEAQVERIAFLLGAHTEPNCVPPPPRRPDPPRAPAAPKPQPFLSGVYFVRAGNAIKIGVSVDVRARVRGLSTSSPVPLELLVAIPGGVDEERALHRRFAHLRMNGEWFRAEAELTDFIATLPPLAPEPERERQPAVRPTPQLDEEAVAALDRLAAIDDPTERAQKVAVSMSEVAADTARLAAIRRRAVLELRERGLSFGDIGRELGLHRNRVQQIAEGRSGGGQGGRGEEA